MREFLRTASRSAYLPIVQTAEETLRSFTASGRALFFFFSGLLVISSFGLLYLLNQSILTSVPAHGGMLTEGIVGSPRFINPILAISEADRDLTSLIYSGLLKTTPEGNLVPDLAASYEISPDGNVYTVTLRKDAVFHNGEPVEAADVVFTVEKTQDPLLKSPQRASWDGVVAEEVDPQTVRFTLEAPYAPFVKNLTLGILPRHLWEGVLSEEFLFSDLNSSPVGSGPFQVASVARSAAGIPSSYELRSFEDYTLGQPYLDSITLRFYQNEEALIEALEEGEVEAASSLSPGLLGQLSHDITLWRSPLNRVFGVFLNQNQSEVLRDHDVREALSHAADRNALVAEVLRGFGTPLNEPVPPTLLADSSLSASPILMGRAAGDELSSPSTDLSSEAREILLQNGWEPNEEGIMQKTTGKGDEKKTLTLSFSIATGNIPELRLAAERLRDAWTAMGARVEVKIFEQGDLSQNVIRPRKYDALLFGEIVGKQLDLFAFWHSSQRNDPGLNIALYANSTADRALEKLRGTANQGERRALYEEFKGELDKDLPAIFLYAPDFVYAFPDRIKGLELGLIETPSDRFLSVASWHEEDEKVWPFFASQR